MRKRWNLHSVAKNTVDLLSDELKIHPSISKVLIQRGHNTIEKASLFLNPSISQLHDPFLMKDMDIAIQRIERAIQDKETILIYGDYDVDGVTSVALMYDFLAKLTPNLVYFIPQRKKDGYGLSCTGIDFGKSKGATLMIALDCGIQGNDEVDYANQLNIDTIICDHHLPQKQLPKAYAILNPRQDWCSYPNEELSGCGIGFKIVQAYMAKNGGDSKELLSYLDLVVLSLACDIVPIIGENRVLSYFGLKILNKKPRLGIQFLIQASTKQTPLTITDIVFGIGPLINAAGRFSDAERAVKLLLSKNKMEADDNIRSLVNKNKERKIIQQRILDEANKMIKLPVKNTIVLYHPDWHIGVLGIIASRISEMYYRPTIILTLKDDLIVGSARSIAGANIYMALEKSKEFIFEFGGHQFAAGLKLEQEHLEQFKISFENAIEQQVSKIDLFQKISIASKLDFHDINASFWHDLKRLAPFGPKNRNPIFLTTNVIDNGNSKIVGLDHLKLDMSQGESKSISGIAFQQGEHLEKVKKKSFDICYNIRENVWQGKSKLNLHIKDIK